jgi:hypothetical protein
MRMRTWSSQLFSRVHSISCSATTNNEWRAQTVRSLDISGSIEEFLVRMVVDRSSAIGTYEHHVPPSMPSASFNSERMAKIQSNLLYYGHNILCPYGYSYSVHKDIPLMAQGKNFQVP